MKRWNVTYKAPISIGMADAFGDTKEEVEKEFRKRYNYFSKERYKVLSIEEH